MKKFSKLFKQQASTPKVALDIMTVFGYDRKKYTFIGGSEVVHMNAQCFWLKKVLQRIQSLTDVRLEFVFSASQCSIY